MEKCQPLTGGDMSTIDLIILGILSEAPMNAYEVTHYISEKQIRRLLKISDPAVYKSCKRMHQNGYLRGKTIKESGLPEKTIYSINAKGKKRLVELMEHYSSNFVPFFIEFNTFIWNLEKIEKKQALRMLHDLTEELKNMKGWIVEHEREAQSSISFPAKMIVKQYSMLISTLVTWSEELIPEYKK